MALGVDGSLELRGPDGTVVRVHGNGSALDVTVDGAQGAGWAGRIGAARRSLPLLRLAAAALDRAGLTASLRVGKRRLATFGRGVEPDGVARTLRVPFARLRG